MKHITLVTLITLLLVTSRADAQEFTLQSADLGGQLTAAQVFSGFGCTGRNISPALKWTNAPAASKSFAITVYDPDAPTGSGWWHWLVFNLPAATSELKAGAGTPRNGLLPKGAVQSVTDYGQPGFGGACPPVGDKAHSYIFTVYALDVAKLDLDDKAAPAMVGFFLNQHAIAKASLIAYYQR